MTAINGRVARLERTYGMHRAPESDEAALLHRLDEVIHLVPTDALRLLCDGFRDDQTEASRSAEQQAVRRQLDLLLETGEWPA
jgi:hypothetical protein